MVDIMDHSVRKEMRRKYKLLPVVKTRLTIENTVRFSVRAPEGSGDKCLFLQKFDMMASSTGENKVYI